MHSSTGQAPFEIVEGGKKVSPMLHTKDKIFEADKYVEDMDEMYKKVKVALEKTQAKQKKAVDRYCREVVFSLGDWVLLRFEKARLKLLENWKIHNAFHVSLLTLYVGDVPKDMSAEEQTKVEKRDEILVPEQILARKERKMKGKVARRNLVKFRNYPPMDAKWMEEDAPDYIKILKLEYTAGAPQGAHGQWVVGRPLSTSFWRDANLSRFAISHVVQRWDTVASLAVKYEVHVTDIKRLNNMMSDHGIYSRKRLLIPVLHAKMVEGRTGYIEVDPYAKREVIVLYMGDDKPPKPTEAEATIAERFRKGVIDSLKKSLQLDDATIHYYLSMAGGDIKKAFSQYYEDLRWERAGDLHGASCPSYV
ncbi:hypothetical protein L7F22_007743 [Adiantum nelumboides]|nr:hypothetical protein [Adiantum nelumboides]